MSESTMERDSVISGCMESCKRLMVVLETVTQDQYSATWQGRDGIGPHVRHCLEHMTALRQGLDGGIIAYDARERNRILETDPVACGCAVQAWMTWLSSLDPEALDAPVETLQLPHVDGAPVRAQSSLRRELLFLTSHTIHHLALVGMLASLHGIVLPETIGLAYATQAHEQRLEANTPQEAAAP